MLLPLRRTGVAKVIIVEIFSLIFTEIFSAPDGVQDWSADGQAAPAAPAPAAAAISAPAAGYQVGDIL